MTSTQVHTKLACDLLSSQRYIKVDACSAPNNCVNHRHQPNQMVKECKSTLPGVGCVNTALTENHSLLKYASYADCVAALAYLNTIIVDMTA